MRKFFLNCVACVVLVLLFVVMWFLNFREFFRKGRYFKFVLTFFVPILFAGWLGGISFVMFGLLPAICFAEIGLLGGIATVTRGKNPL